MGKMMKATFALTTALLLVSGGASADNGNHFGQDKNGNNGNHYGEVRGAPGPIAGAGVPVFLVAAGVYWLVRRKRRMTK
jgi:hypothetical protein